MGEVNIRIGGRSFRLGCDDGEEQHLLVLAKYLDKHVEAMRRTVGNAGDEQLYLMAGLMICDELWDAREQLLQAEKKIADLSARQETREKGEAAKSARPAAKPQAGPVSAPATPSVDKQS